MDGEKPETVMEQVDDEIASVYPDALADAREAVKIAETAGEFAIPGGPRLRVTPDAVLAHIGRLREQQGKDEWNAIVGEAMDTVMRSLTRSRDLFGEDGPQPVTAVPTGPVAPSGAPATAAPGSGPDPIQ